MRNNIFLALLTAMLVLFGTSSCFRYERKYLKDFEVYKPPSTPDHPLTWAAGAEGSVEYQLSRAVTSSPAFKDSGISVLPTEGSLASLERMKIIEIRDGKFCDISGDLHLPKDSPLFTAWKAALNQLAMSRIKLLEETKTYNFSVIFGATEETRRQIHEGFLQYLKKVRKVVEKAKCDEIFQMNFDLFSWTQIK